MSFLSGRIFLHIILAVALFPLTAHSITLKIEEASGPANATIPVKIMVDDQDDPSEIAGAAFTVNYNSEKLNLKSVQSEFFQTFTAQSIEPNSVTYDGTDYDEPISFYPPIGSEDIDGSVQIAAARIKPETNPANLRTLFILEFELKDIADAGGTYPITVSSSTILNNSGNPETIPMLLGADPSKDLSDPDAYPVLLDPESTPAVGSVTFGVLDSIRIDGATTINENENTPLTVTAVWNDASESEVVPDEWSMDPPDYASIDENGTLTASAVTQNRDVVITASFTVGGTPYTANHTITVVDTGTSLVSLTISGAATVDENESANYTAEAVLDDGSSFSVTTDSVWSLDSGEYAAIDGNGTLTASTVTQNQTVVLTASYTCPVPTCDVSVTKEDTHSVTIRNAETLLTEILIEGSSMVNEDQHATYTVTAYYDDGTTSPVGIPTWILNSPHLLIDASTGKVTASSMVQDQVVTLEASYTEGGLTKTKTMEITIHDLPETERRRLPRPIVRRLLVQDGPRQSTQDVILLAQIDGDSTGDPTHYRVWDQYETEPTTWLPLPAKNNDDGYYHITDVTLSSLNTSTRIYLKAKGELAASNAKSAGVRLMDPIIINFSPQKMPRGSSAPMVVRGRYFGDGTGLSSITFDGVAAAVTSWSDDEIQCTLPITVPTGRVYVVVVSEDGLEGRAKPYTVWPFWAGTWTGRVDQTDFSLNDGENLGHEWRIYWIEPLSDGRAMVKMTDGRRLLTDDPVPEDFSPGDSFMATGFTRYGTETEVTFTYSDADSNPDANQMKIDYQSVGRSGWTETGQETEPFTRPSDSVFFSMWYTGESMERWTLTGGDLPFEIGNDHIYRFVHKADRLTIKEIYTGRANYNGYVEGDVFVVHFGNSTLSGRVVQTDGQDTVTEIDSAYRWESSDDTGWGTMDIHISDGTSGLTDATSLWQLTFTENEGGDIQTVPAEITVNGNVITVVLTDVTLGPLSVRLARGRIYETPEGDGGGRFWAKGGRFTIWGRMEQNGTDDIIGTFEQKDLLWDGDKEGTIDGDPDP